MLENNGSAKWRNAAIVMFTFALAIGLVPAHAATGPSEGDTRIEIPDDLRAALSTAEPVRVIVSLVEPTAMSARPLDVADLRIEVATTQSRVLESIAAGDFQLARRFEAVNAFVGTVPSLAAAERIAQLPEVRGVALDSGGSGGLADTIPLIGADTRHAVGNLGATVTVAVVDSGVDTDHDDLQSDLVGEQCFLDDDGAIDGVGLCPNGSDRQSGPGSAEDDQGHGTHVSGIVTSDGVQASVGVAPGADLVAIKVLDSTNTFYFFSEIVAALDYIIVSQPDVEVINMSLGTFAQWTGECDTDLPAGAMAVDTLRASGTITFAAAGNNASGTTMGAPACLSGVVAVGATDDNDIVAGFSQSNAFTEVFAPGVSVVSSGLGNVTDTISGTSMASPHAAGCAALLIDSGDATTPAAIETRLKTSPVSVTDPTNGLSFPRIDCSVDDGADGDVEIDIEPRDPLNRVRRSGLVSVAVLTTATFDALTVDVSTVGFGPNAAPPQRWRAVDVDGDGDLDLLLQFRSLMTGISRFDTEACLTGSIAGGATFMACDAVQLVLG